MMPRRFRPPALLVLAISLASCATVSREIETGADRAGRTLARIGNRIEDGAETARRQTTTLWQRLFGGKPASQSAPRKPPARSAEAPAPAVKPATFDTYTEERIGS